MGHRGTVLGCVGGALLLALSACEESDGAGRPEGDASYVTDVADGPGPDADGGEPDGAETPEPPLRPRSRAMEYVGLKSVRPIEEGALLDVLSRLVGVQAEAGDHLDRHELQPGLYLSSEPAPTSAEQVILTLEMAVSGDAEPAERTVARVPASFGYGGVFLDSVAAALEVTADRGDGMRPWRLEHRARSAMGGELSLVVDFGDSGVLSFGVDARGPRTSLLDDQLNEPAFAGAPYETVYGKVFFELSRDDFDFFVTRAYGISAGKSQNFEDFWLLPHEWLRLTVVPELDQERVDVRFELMTTDGRRVPVSRAPASLRAGEQFMQTVLRMVDNMAAREEAMPGSSVPFEVPFYYDDPEGGGVVEVIAHGEGGRFRIAYAVETPVQHLDDVPFVPYAGEVEIPDDWDAVDPTCAELGSEPASQGFFDVTFAASTTVLGSDKIEGPVRGPVWGSVFKAEDVVISGPVDGAEAVASFHFEDVDVTDGEHDEVLRIDTQLLAGEYQILGFMDVDGNADPDDPDPDPGDPVMIPIGGFELECAEHPVVAEFALLMPE